MAETKLSIIITGASRGIGRAMAVKFSEDGGIVEKIAKGSKMVLMSRNIPELEKTGDMIQNKDLEVRLMPFDLGVERDLIAYTQLAFDFFGDPKQFDKNVLVLNADAEYGTWTPAAELQNLQELTKYFTVNLSSCIYQSAKFCSYFSFEKCLIVNMSTQAALFPFKNTSLTCTSKAAKQMFLNCLKTDHPTVKVLHYTPGAVETETFKHFMERVNDQGMKMFFDKMYQDGKVVKASDTATKLAKILREDTFASGDFIDYYEDPEYFAQFFSQM